MANLYENTARLTAEEFVPMLDARFTQLAEEMQNETGAFEVITFATDEKTTYMSATMADMSTVALVQGGKNVEYVPEDQPTVDELREAITDSMARVSGQPLGRVVMTASFLTRMEDLGKSNDVGKISNILWDRVLVEYPSFVALRDVAKEKGWLVHFTENRKSFSAFLGTEKEQETAEQLGEWSWYYNLKLQFVRDSMDINAEFITFDGGDRSQSLFPELKKRKAA